MASVMAAEIGISQKTMSSSPTSKDPNHFIEIDLPTDVGDQLLRNTQSGSHNKSGLSLMLGKQPVSICQNGVPRV